jgi:hypothetical protein
MARKTAQKPHSMGHVIQVKQCGRGTVYLCDDCMFSRNEKDKMAKFTEELTLAAWNSVCEGEKQNSDV